MHNLIVDNFLVFFLKLYLTVEPNQTEVGFKRCINKNSPLKKYFKVEISLRLSNEVDVISHYYKMDSQKYVCTV